MKVFGKTMQTGVIALSLIAFTVPAFAQAGGGGASGGSGGGGDSSSAGGPPGLNQNSTRSGNTGSTGSVSPSTGTTSGGPGSMQETTPRPSPSR